VQASYGVAAVFVNQKMISVRDCQEAIGGTFFSFQRRFRRGSVIAAIQ
jgi:hypothetical protein